MCVELLARKKVQLQSSEDAQQSRLRLDKRLQSYKVTTGQWILEQLGGNMYRKKPQDM